MTGYSTDNGNSESNTPRIAVADHLESTATDHRRFAESAELSGPAAQGFYAAAKAAATHLRADDSCHPDRGQVAAALDFAAAAHSISPDTTTTSWLHRVAVAASALLRSPVSEHAHQSLGQLQPVFWLNGFGSGEPIGIVRGEVIGETVPRGLEDSWRPESLSRCYELLIEAPWGVTPHVVDAAELVAVPAHLVGIVELDVNYRAAE
ncbi:hypothetical protein ACFVVM_32500 [Nocardia sp. NPDC058176]|uniref:hypothetical protein n=1 Tax=Nocardia sp. NPDC058176 TaxID=3346368 RepID=UPI0036DB07D1